MVKKRGRRPPSPLVIIFAWRRFRPQVSATSPTSAWRSVTSTARYTCAAQGRNHVIMVATGGIKTFAKLYFILVTGYYVNIWPEDLNFSFFQMSNPAQNLIFRLAILRFCKSNLIFLYVNKCTSKKNLIGIWIFDSGKIARRIQFKNTFCMVWVIWNFNFFRKSFD